MKILRVEGTNLASLPHFEIDFRKLLGGRNEVFAIIGDTGAGKSTILDAICLGIYGNTPRIGKFNPRSGSVALDDGFTIPKYDPMNLMTRGESRCSATVDFVAGNGSVYRSCFEIFRRKTKFTRRFRISLLDDSGNIVRTEVDVENKMSVQDLAVSYTGLTWEQFRRVIILPQGEFAAFLDDNSDVKLTLLEKLTGTEIYKNIDLAARNRMEILKNQLADIKNRMEIFEAQILPDEDVQAKKQELSVIREKLDTVSAMIKAAEDFAGTRKEIREQEAGISGEEAARDSLKSELDNLRDERRTVILHDLAAPARDLYAGITLLKNTLEELTQKNEKLKASLGDYEKNLEESQTAFSEKERIHNERSREREMKEPDLTRAEGLEKKISGIESTVNGLQENRKAEEEVLSGVKSELEKRQESRNAVSGRLKILEEEHRKDEKFNDLVPVWNELNGNLPAYRNAVASLVKLQNDANEHDGKIAAISGTLNGEAVRYRELSGDNREYSFTEGNLPDPEPCDNVLTVLQNWHGTASGLSDGIKLLEKHLTRMEGHAEKFAESAVSSATDLEALIDSRKALAREEENLRSRTGDIENAARLEQARLDAQKELSGLEGEMKTQKDAVRKLEQRNDILNREQEELRGKIAALEQEHSRDESWNFLKDSWNDLMISAGKHRMIRQGLIKIGNDISAKEKTLAELRNSWNGKLLKYQEAAGDSSSFSIEEELAPDAMTFEETAAALGRFQKISGDLEHRALDLGDKTREYLKLAVNFSENAAVFAGEREELLKLLDGNSPIHAREQRISELEKSIRTCQGMIKVSEIAVSLKPGEECPCCGSRVHPRLDGAASDPGRYLEEASRARDEYEKELTRVNDELSGLRSRKTLLSASVKTHAREFPAASAEIFGKAEELSGLAGTFREKLESLGDLIPEGRNNQGRIGEARKTLLEIRDRGLALPLFSGKEISEFSFAVSAFADGFGKVPAGPDENDISPEFAEKLPLPDKDAAGLKALEEYVRKLCPALERFAGTVLPEKLDDAARIENCLRGVPLLVGDIRNLGEKYRAANTELEGLRRQETEAEGSLRETVYSDTEEMSGIWRDLTEESDEQKYRTRVTELGETVKRINAYDGDLGKLQTAMEAKDAEISASLKDLTEQKAILAGTEKLISGKNAQIAGIDREISGIIGDNKTVAAFRDQFAAGIKEAEKVLENSRARFAESCGNLRNLRDLMARAFNDICSERERLSGNLDAVLEIREKIPEQDGGFLAGLRDHFQSISERGRRLFVFAKDNAALEIPGLVSQYLADLDGARKDNAEDSGIPAVPEIPDLKPFISEVSDFGASLPSVISGVADLEKRIGETAVLVRNARNSQSVLENERTALAKTLNEIKTTGERMKKLVVDNGNLQVADVWKELSSLSESDFKTGIARYQGIIDRLSAYDGNHRTLSAELDGLTNTVAAFRDRETAVTDKLETIARQLAEQETLKQETLKEIAVLTGGLSVSGFRTALDKAVNDAAAEVNKARLALKASEKDLDSQNRIIREGEAEYARKETELSENEKELSGMLQEIASRNPGYSEDDLRDGLGVPEDAYRAARDRVQGLSEKIRELDTRIGEHKALLGKLSARLSGLREKFPSDSFTPEGDLSEEISLGFVQEKKDLDETAQELSRCLKNNEESSQKRASCIADQEKLRNDNSALYDLCQMFGKKDGFARYAQTITFGYLISRANIYIRDFTERRYELCQAMGTQNNGKALNPFEITVIDHDRGGKSRIVSSLSGGEKFRVALGLAFGLSDLVSSNVRVDNMFIDEGFDTLDNERLDRLIIAMSAVSSRQIGIITHVDQIVNGAMIRSRIRVQKSAGDPSRSEVKFE